MELEEPPALERNPDRKYWADVVETLKSNPGKAGKSGPHSIGVANHIRNGRYAAFIPPGVKEKDEYAKRHWYVTSRKSEPHEGKRRQWVYVTWLGDQCPCRWCSSVQN